MFRRLGIVTVMVFACSTKEPPPKPVDELAKAAERVGPAIAEGKRANEESEALLAEIKEKRAEMERLQKAGSALSSKSGTIAEVPLIDLVQLLNTSRKSGALVVKTETATGTLYVRSGEIYFASIDKSPTQDPLEAAYVILNWTAGSFELDPDGTTKVANEIKTPTAELAMEALRHKPTK